MKSRSEKTTYGNVMYYAQMRKGGHHDVDKSRFKDERKAGV